MGINEGFHLATYGYKANVGSVETVGIKRVGVERVRHDRTTDALGKRPSGCLVGGRAGGW